MNQNRYKRQTTLKEVGVNGQEKLGNTSVIIIGCGGLGGEVAVHLAASGIGEITLIDNDLIQESNLHRQVFFKENDLNKPKAECLAKYIQKQNSLVKVNFKTLLVEKENALELLKPYEIIIDCTDSLQTKYLLNDACLVLEKPFFYASLHKYEGQVAVFNILQKDGTRSGNLRDIFPEIPTENIPSCSEVGTLNTVVSLIASLQTNEVLKYVLGMGNLLTNTLLIYNTLENEMFKIKYKVKQEVNALSNWKLNTYKDKVCLNFDSSEIDKIQFDRLLIENKIKVISVLEEEFDLNFDVDLHFPFSSFDIDKMELPNDNYVVVCLKGKTSLKAVLLLKEKFPNSSFKSLVGGCF